MLKFFRKIRKTAKTCVYRTKNGNLSPLSPKINGLSPLILGTDLFNADNDLRDVFGFVPIVPSFLCRYPEEKNTKNQKISKKSR